MFWRLLLLATSLVLACQQKHELPRIPKLMIGRHANPLIGAGNGAAAGRILRLGPGAGSR